MSDALERALLNVPDRPERSEVLGRVFPLDPAPGTSLLFGGGVRRLRPGELVELEAAGCAAEDWDDVLVTDGFEPRHVSRVRFGGRVVIGRTGLPIERTEGYTVRSGLHDCTIVDCEIGHGALVERVDLLRRMIVDEGACVAACREVTHEIGSDFGNGRTVHTACRPGGRPIPVFAEMRFGDAAAIAAHPADDAAKKKVAGRISALAANCASRFGYLGPGARITATDRVHACWIGPAAEVRNARSVTGSTILSRSDRRTVLRDGVIVRDSLVQWGAMVADTAFVEGSLICEGGTIERHAMVLDSVIGPDCLVAEGEISKSLVGPLVGFHHQALLVAAHWPTGRGNVGHGANVGSNHTGRAPDQEILVGEGVFFGLGVNVKMPADFSRAPYLLIATGVDTLPQRVTMPFALVSVPMRRYGDHPSAINEIRPGWMLSENAYALARNEAKFAQRQRARVDPLDVRVFRPEIMHHVLRAKNELAAVSGRDWYTDRQVPGIGKNVLPEEARIAAIEAYRHALRRYSLTAFFERLRSGLDADPDIPSRDPAWEHARSALVTCTTERDPATLLRLMIAETVRWTDAVANSKMRDDERGPRIIADYADAHPGAETDPVVLNTRAQLARLRDEVERLIGRL